MQREVRSEQDDLDKDTAGHFRHEEMRLVYIVANKLLVLNSYWIQS
jgi:hypothetical protein